MYKYMSSTKLSALHDKGFPNGVRKLIKLIIKSLNHTNVKLNRQKRKS